MSLVVACLAYKEKFAFCDLKFSSYYTLMFNDNDKARYYFRVQALSMGLMKSSMFSVTFLNVILDNTVLDRISHTKFLGVLIDENLTWKYHIDCVSKTLSRNIGIMNKLKYFVPDRILHTLYCTFILPYINYGILIWGNTC